MNSGTMHTQRVIEVDEADLPLHCPMPGDGMWSGHPRVFLPIQDRGESLCPYCGTLYKMRGWTGQSGHPH